MPPKAKTKSKPAAPLLPHGLSYVPPKSSGFADKVAKNQSRPTQPPRSSLLRSLSRNTQNALFTTSHTTDNGAEARAAVIGGIPRPILPIRLSASQSLSRDSRTSLFADLGTTDDQTETWATTVTDIPRPAVAFPDPKNTIRADTHSKVTITKKSTSRPVVKKTAVVKLGISPFPNYPRPTPEESYRVHKLLEAEHGSIVVPEVPNLPSLNIAGCGDVPFILDALMRTLISQNTTMPQANTAISNIVKTFGCYEYGHYAGTINWNKVRLSKSELLMEAIRPAGTQDKKTEYIKKTLQMVWEENEDMRQDATLIDGNDRVAVTFDKSHKRSTSETERSKFMASLGKCIVQEWPDMLTLDYLHSWSTNDAFARLCGFSGIGAKTAACVLLFCMRRPVFAVDTHVWRLCTWLGWVPPPKPTANETFVHCDVRIPDGIKYSLHQLMIIHGQECKHCNAKSIGAHDDPPCVLETRCMGFRSRKDRERLTAATLKKKKKDDSDSEKEVIVPKSTSKKSNLKRPRENSEETISVDYQWIPQKGAAPTKKPASAQKEDNKTASSESDSQVIVVQSRKTEDVASKAKSKMAKKVIPQAKPRKTKVVVSTVKSKKTKDPAPMATASYFSDKGMDIDDMGNNGGETMVSSPLSAAPSSEVSSTHSGDDEGYEDENVNEEEQDEDWPTETDNEEDSDFEGGSSSSDDVIFGRAFKVFETNPHELDS